LEYLGINGNIFKSFHRYLWNEINIRKKKEVRKGMSMPKFMQTLDDSVYRKLKEIAKQRGITIQELIRAVIIPEWLEKHEKESS